MGTVSSEVASPSKGWVISPKSDALAFWGSLVAGAATFHPSMPPMNTVGPFFLLLVVPIDAAHIIATYFPAQHRVSSKRITALVAMMIPLIVAALCLAIFSVSSQVFFSLLGSLTLLHVMRQQYGWVTVSSRGLGEARSERAWDRVMIWNIMLFPVMWWLCSESTIEKSFFVANDLAFLQHVIPSTLARVGLIVHWLVLAVCVVRAVRLRRWPIGKALFFASTWLWFYGGLAIFQSPAFFFTVSLISHGVSYMLYSFKTTQPEVPQKPGWARVLGFVLTVEVCAFLWVAAILAVEYAAGNDAASLWIPALRSLTMTHIVFDSFMWRSSFRNGDDSLLRGLSNELNLPREVFP